MASIELTGLTKRFPDGTEAVRAVDLEVADGEFMILVGPSGCGKSTALRMVAGLEEITDGELRIDGQVVNDLPPKRRDIAMVFQNYALYPHLSVRDNMGFALKFSRVPKTEVREKVLEAARILDLEHELDRKPAALSGGQRQRVAMGRAIVRDPKAFLMDEPLSNLDAKLRVQMRSEISGIQRRLGTTTVYVTHDQTEAMTLGDRVAVMRAGVIQQVDAPTELYEHPANLFVAGFIGSPAMNLFRAEVADGRLRLPFGDVAAPAGAAPGEVIAGVRPEQIERSADVDTAGRLVLTVTAAAVEALGSESYVHFEVPGGAVEAPGARDAAEASSDARDPRRAIARIGPAVRPVVGDQLELALDPAGVKLFDPETGDARPSADRHA